VRLWPLTGYTRYRVSTYFAACLIVGYLTIALHYRNDEQFPFFNWSLFSYSPNPRSDVAIVIRTVDGKTLPKPRLFIDMPDTFLQARLRNVNVWKTEWNLVDAIHAGDTKKANEYRQVIEQDYMADVKSVGYEIALITYSPIRRLRTGVIDKMDVVASYEKSAP